MSSIRARFSRGEEVKFISHLDLMKVFERAIRRSGLPISYSQGFNPHPQIVFGLPLAVGMTSECEYADFELAREISAEQFMGRLNGFLPKGVSITAAAEKRAKSNIMASISGADYVISIFLDEPLPFEEASKRFDAFMKKEKILMQKEIRGKDGGKLSKEIDIRPLVLEACIVPLETMPPGYEGFKAAFAVKAKFKAGSSANLSPELFIKALAEHAGIPSAACRIHRKALYVEAGGEMVDPLDRAAIL